VSDKEAQTGDVVAGRYQFGDEMGRGGHGVVFRAYDRHTNIEVALKVLRQNIAEDPQYAVRLWREAQSFAALWGSSVVRPFGHGEPTSAW
jgi:serine/threonine-protein kinase